MSLYGALFGRIKFFWKRNWNKTLGKEDLGKTYDEARKALEMQYLGVPIADQTDKLASAAEKLVNALSAVENGVVRMGALIVVKRTQNVIPELLIQQLTNQQIIALDKKPHLCNDVEKMYFLLKNDNSVFKSLDDTSEEAPAA
jgi:hypothetical protein